MSFVVKEDEALDPIDVGLLRANAVTFDPDTIANLVQQFGLVGAEWLR